MADAKKFSVLIIDDNDATRMMLRHILVNNKYDVVGETAHGALALEMTEKLRPDIICLDIMLPDCNGIDLLKQLKIQFPDVPVLMVTGSNDRETVVNAIVNGASGYIVKPFNPSTLLRTLADAVTKPPAV